MTRRQIVAGIACGIIGAENVMAADPIDIEIAAKSIKVTIPTISRADLINIMSTFLSRENKEVKSQLDHLLSQGGDITLVLTTGHVERR